MRLSSSFSHTDTVDLLPAESVNGYSWTLEHEGDLHTLYRPQRSALDTGVGPHLVSFDRSGRPVGAPEPLLATGQVLGYPPLHSTSRGLVWAWVDPGDGFDPGAGEAPESYTLRWQPLGRAERVDPRELFSSAGRGARHLEIRSWEHDGRLDLLWPGRGPPAMA